ncbi:MAG: hypothetical protein ACKVUS_03220 [Saprospiraceae bacterium]
MIQIRQQRYFSQSLSGAAKFVFTRAVKDESGNSANISTYDVYQSILLDNFHTTTQRHDEYDLKALSFVSLCRRAVA